MNSLEAFKMSWFTELNCKRLTRIKNKIYIQNTQTINISEASDVHIRLRK